jgi:hypothetical protein
VDQEAERDKLIEFGMRLDDFFKTMPGKILLGRLEEKIGITANDMMFARGKKGKVESDFTCVELSHFERHRGFALGVKWVLDQINSIINTAKRAEEDRKQEKSEDTNP